MPVAVLVFLWAGDTRWSSELLAGDKLPNLTLRPALPALLSNSVCQTRVILLQKDLCKGKMRLKSGWAELVPTGTRILGTLGRICGAAEQICTKTTWKGPHLKTWGLQWAAGEEGEFKSWQQAPSFLCLSLRRDRWQHRKGPEILGHSSAWSQA